MVICLTKNSVYFVEKFKIAGPDTYIMKFYLFILKERESLDQDFTSLIAEEIIKSQ